MTPPKAGRAEAAELIWDWDRHAQQATSERSSTRERRRGAIQAAIGALVAGTLLWVGLRPPALVVASAATVILLSSQLIPHGVYAMLERVALAFGRRIGWALTWILMVSLFYLFFYRVIIARLNVKLLVLGNA